MSVNRWWVRGATAAAACLVSWVAGPSAWAQNALDVETMKLYGGTYLADCKNPVSARVTIARDALVYVQGSKRVSVGNVQAQFSYFGRSEPEGYRVAIVSESPDGAQLVVIVYSDAAGDYVTLDGDAKFMNQIGRQAATVKYRRCDAATQRPPGQQSPGQQPSGQQPSGQQPPGPQPTGQQSSGQRAPGQQAPAPSTPPPSDQLPDASGMITNPKFRAAYYKSLGGMLNVPWLARLDGPTSQSRRVTVVGQPYTLVNSCKTHDCGDNNTVLLYSPGRSVVYGIVYSRGRSVLIGKPPPAVAIELRELWKAEFRQGQ